MKPQAAAFLEKSRELLARADKMLGVGLNEDAGRTAYLAAFHAAQALIFEHRDKTVKTHKGVRTEFLRLTKNDALIDPELRAFLGRAYNLKAIADYETGPGSQVLEKNAREAIQTARRFVECITTFIPPSGL